MSRIKCKAGDKVVLYRKDGVFPNVPIGTVFTMVHCGDGTFAQLNFKDNNYWFLPRTHLRHLRKTDKGARVVIIRADGLPFWHGFNINSVVTITGVKSKWKDEDIYEARDDHEYPQWLHPSQFKLAKEQ